MQYGLEAAALGGPHLRGVVHVVPQGVQGKKGPPAQNPRSGSAEHAFSQRKSGRILRILGLQQGPLKAFVTRDVNASSNGFRHGVRDKGRPVGPQRSDGPVSFGRFHQKDVSKGAPKGMSTRQGLQKKAIVKLANSIVLHVVYLCDT